MSTSLHVLVIEDSEDDTGLLIRELQKGGYDVKYKRVETPVAMRSALAENDWNIVISDYSMPQFSGLAALSLLQKTGLDLPFILVSGTIGEEAAVAAMKAGAHDYLLKGNLARLIPAIERELRDAEIRRERRQAQDELRASEDRYRDLVENSQDLICTHDLEGRILSVNPFAERTLGYKIETLLRMNIRDLLGTDARPQFDAYLSDIQTQGFAEGMMVVQTKAGKRRIWEYRNTLRTDGVTVPIVRGIARDITERKQAEEALREAEQQLHTIVNNAPMTIFATDQRGVFTLSEGKSLEQVGLMAGENVGVSALDLYATLPVFEDDGAVTTCGSVVHRVLSGESVRGITKLRNTYFENQFVPLRDVNSQVVGLIGVAIDVTDRKRAEEELRIKDLAIATSINAIAFSDLEGGLTYINRSFLNMWGYDNEREVLGRSALEFWQMPEKAAEVMRALANQQSRIGELTAKRKDGTIFEVQIAANLVTDETGRPIRMMSSFIDITDRKQAEEKNQQQLRRLSALSEIDRTIASSFDMKLSLGTILTHLTSQLGVDAADVLLLNPASQTLEYYTGHGFQTKIIEQSLLRLGEGYAGRAASERHLISVSNLKQHEDAFVRKSLLDKENFVSYFAVPLIVKGKVKGLLEIFHRSQLKPNQEWLDFLNTLAGQAAIAVDNITLFYNLQSSNIDLALAYDATIEGWSRALDLRDKETEGHTQRVTEMSVALARLFDLNEDELVQVRRGALLHDIGKMGVPDAILLKPEPLTDEEWVIMKKHPTFAYEMLSPIRYLKSALDIPYCHHEKWDGTGYPRGLKGEQIPLVARIFAVVDVWDALTSDRPYRPAWTKEKTMEYIQSLAGTHFDPRAVKVCLESGILVRSL